MTEIGGESFERLWPLASASVDRLLRAHHVSAADREDIVQEVAARAFVRQDEFTSLNHLTRWSCRVAANLRVDQLRRERRHTDAEVPERAAAVETAQLVEGRVALEAVLSAVSQLSDADRIALFGDRERSEDRREAVKFAVRRHRARARLAAMVEGMIAAFAALNRAILRRGDTPGVREAVAIGSVAIVAVALPVIGAAGGSQEPTQVRQPTSRASMVSEERAVPAGAPTPRQDQVDVRRHDRVGADASVARPTHDGRTIVELRPDGKAGARIEEVHPERPRTLCVGNVMPGSEHCIDRPGPPLPTLPPIPE